MQKNYHENVGKGIPESGQKIQDSQIIKQSVRQNKMESGKKSYNVSGLAAHCMCVSVNNKMSKLIEKH